MRFMEFSGCGVCRKDGVRGCGYSIRAASSKPSRGERAKMLAGSPWPRLTRKLDLMVVPLKKASSTFALSKPDIGPVSRPSARGQDQVGALQAAVAERRLAASIAGAVEPAPGVGMREQVGEIIVRSEGRRVGKAWVRTGR